MKQHLVHLTLSVLSAFALLGCGDHDAPLPNYDLLADPTSKEHGTAEQERMRKMQLVTVLDAAHNPQEISAQALEQIIETDCSSVESPFLTCPNQVGAAFDLCVAETALALTRPQATMPTIGTSGNGAGPYLFPAQRPSTIVDIAHRGKGYASQAGSEFAFALEDYEGLGPFGLCDSTQGAFTSNGRIAAVEAGSGLARSFDVFKALADAEVQASLDTADAELNSTTSSSLASERAIKEWRLGAANALGAGATQLPFGPIIPNGAFCSRPSATPDVKAAIAVFRDAGLDPNALLSSTDTETLLNGTGMTVPNGSVRQRLVSFYQSPGLINGRSVQDQFSLNTSTFEEARANLVEEITAFSRSLAPTSVLPHRRRDPNGVDSMYDTYVATAGPPKRLPAAYYGALVRFPVPPPAPGTIWPDIGSADDLGYYGVSFDSFMTAAKTILVHADGLDASLRETAIGQLGLMLAGTSELGTIRYDSSPYEQILIAGFGGDEVQVVDGDDQLRCAVQGSVEGANCTLTLHTPVNWPPNGTSFSKAAHLIAGFTQPRIYVIRPKRVLTNPGPGDYEALIGFDRGTHIPTTVSTEYPIIAGLDERLAAIMEPSTNGCVRPRLNCDGSAFDERIPLEDELTDNSNGVEDSWKHYLDLARTAAERADALGVAYIQSGLQNSQRQEDVELRQEQQRAQADAELQKLQQLCGITSDTRSLAALLTSASAGENLASTGNVCHANTQGQDCAGDGEAFKCQLVAGTDTGRCAIDLDLLLTNANGQAGAAADPDIQRIRDCINPSSNDPFVSLGDRPLCLWQDVNNPNSLCRGADPGTCPRVAEVAACPIYSTGPACFASCSDTLGTIPAGTVVAQSTPLKYFSMSSGGAGGDADLYASIGKNLTTLAWPTIRDQVRDQQLLNGIRFSDVVKALDFRLYGGGTILYQGQPLYSTGSVESGPNSTHWPCAAVANEDPLTGDVPPSFDCNGDAATDMLFRTVAAAKTMDASQVDNKFVGDVKQYTFSLWDHALTSFAGAGNYELPDGSFLQLSTCDSTETVVKWDHSSFLKYNCKPGFIAGSELYAPQTFGIDVANGNGLGFVFWGITDVDGPWPAWLGRYLNGNSTNPIPQTSDVVATVTWSSGAPRMPGDPSGRGQEDLTGQDYLRALAMVSALQAKPTVASLDAPPQVKTIEDLDVVSQYLDLLAKTIRNKAGEVIFANVPLKVEDALRGETAAGSFPQFGGDMAEAISSARGALLRIHENGPLVANEVQQMSSDIRELKILLQKSSIRQQLAGLQFASTMGNELSSCAASLVGGIGLDPLSGAGHALAGAITCANAIAQIGIAADVEDLSKQDGALDGELAVAQFGQKFSAHAAAMQGLSLHLAEGQEDLDAALAKIDSIRGQARSALVDALEAGSFQAAHQAEVSSAIGNLASGDQIKYAAALKNARRLAFLAKRAIEQRLGVRLADLTEDYPLVEAPQKWEATACTFAGVDYAKLASTDPNAPQSFADGFIGNYVTKLENFVESYRLQNNFHEGTDTAIISLRDDLMNVRADCDIPGPNLLLNAGQLDGGIASGWSHTACPTQDVGGVTQPGSDCVTVTPSNPGPAFKDANIANANGYGVTFGANSNANSALVQTVNLNDGVYRLTWYTQVDETTGEAAKGLVLGGAGLTQSAEAVDAATQNDAWQRHYKIFQLSDTEAIKVGFGKPTHSPANIHVAAPMLERLPPNAGTDLALLPFFNTTDTTTVRAAACQDTDGAVFRTTRWTRNCTHLCADGFADNCSDNRSTEYCYQEAQFGFSQRDIQLGKVFNFSGFARGNFNYRIESVGLNFVGTGIRNCGNATTPQPCYGGGFVPYSLSHVGPFFVRNDKGADVQAFVFDGNIEHARGLATERYLTNPMSDADRTLSDQFSRHEFNGRPLDGNFVLRVWEEQGVDFNNIEDVQMVLNYRYWTPFN